MDADARLRQKMADLSRGESEAASKSAFVASLRAMDSYRIEYGVFLGEYGRVVPPAKLKALHERRLALYRNNYFLLAKLKDALLNCDEQAARGIQSQLDRNDAFDGELATQMRALLGD
jgi:hypothetical protein